MDSVHFRFPPEWALRLLGRNQLLRMTDRLEVLLVAAAVLVVVSALAGAGVLGTAVNEARTRMYAKQTQARHAETATAIADSTTTIAATGFRSFAVNITVPARWRVDGVERSGRLTSDRARSVGDSFDVWLDRDGNPVDAPTAVSRAGIDAVGVAVLAWLGVVVAVTVLAVAGRVRLNRVRDAAWEREIAHLVNGDGGRANRRP